MTQETRTEVVIFSGLAMFLGALWWMNRQQGSGTGAEDLPFFGGTGDGSGAGSLTGNGPMSFNVGGNTYTGPTFGGETSPDSGGSCCSACSSGSGMVAFGDQNDLLNFLAQSGTPSASDVAGWINNWT